jgi:DNA-binding NtrC family response regulator
MRRVREQITLLAALPWHVRIEGPTGSGKNVAARLLHSLSNRASRPFVYCSLAMLPDGMELSELVGHRRGAFTGAIDDQAGAFENAHTGTLFLDEIGAASPRSQLSLLRLVDEGITRRLGESRDRVVDVRIVFATNLDLEESVLQGQFRDDLLARMRVLVVRLPSLADHPEDIPELSEHILERKCRQAGMSVCTLAANTLDRLMNYSWPRNVRDLESALEYYVAFGVLPKMIEHAPHRDDWRQRVDAVLGKHGGRKAPAARELGVSRETLYAELRRRQA